MSKGAVGGVTRGCGKRKKGGIYLEVSMGPYGQPLEFFLVDPPEVADTDAMGISPVGVKVLNAIFDTWHVFDWVGSEHYPNVADFIEEARRFGISRRLSKSIDFSKITPESRLILLHSRAYIAQRQEYLRDRQNREGCPKNIKEHNRGFELKDPGMCLGLCYEDIEGGVQTPESKASSGREVIRQMPSFEYTGFMRPQGYGEPTRNVAIFASFPVSRLVVIKDDEGDSHHKAIKAASASSLEMELVEE